MLINEPHELLGYHVGLQQTVGANELSGHGQLWNTLTTAFNKGHVAHLKYWLTSKINWPWMIHSLLKHFGNHPLRKGSRIAVVGSWMLVKYVSFTQRWEIPLKWNRRFGIPRLTKWACFLIYFKPGCSRSRPWLHPLHSPNLDLFASRHVNPFKAFKRHKRHGSSSWQWCEFIALLSTAHWWLQKKMYVQKFVNWEVFSQQRTAPMTASFADACPYYGITCSLDIYELAMSLGSSCQMFFLFGGGGRV